MPAEPAGDFEPYRIIEVLNRHGVEFIVIGGLAAQLHGATRSTQDLDVVPHVARENMQRLTDAMKELGARIRAAGFSDEDARQAAKWQLHPQFLRENQLTTWRTDAGDLDVLHDMPNRDGDRLRYEQLVDRSQPAVHAGVTVRVAALDDIRGVQGVGEPAQGPRGPRRAVPAAGSRRRRTGPDCPAWRSWPSARSWPGGPNVGQRARSPGRRSAVAA